ncbi:MAG: pyridoxamine 5'-phosphate oxidase [Pseudomonadota bacterium]
MENWLDVGKDPFVAFDEWYQENLKSHTFEPTAMTLATVDPDGMPSARVVLLKKFDRDGFCFFTNYESRKGQELLKNGRAALVFHWEKPSHRQVRIRGFIEKMSSEESQEYFSSRARGSQVGAWASPQSQVIKSREELVTLVQDVEKRFADKKIPCPSHWGGFRLKPVSIEFWQAQDHRLHDRIYFSFDATTEKWKGQRLAP